MQKYKTLLESLSHVKPMPTPPKLLNYHLMVKSPFPESIQAVRHRLNELDRVKYTSNLYKEKVKEIQSNSPDCSVLPLPNLLVKHLENPYKSWLDSSLPKITGFRIQVTGRRGSRSSKQVVHYGKIGSKDVANTLVDFGKSHFVTRKGATGVQVWIGYST